jgi:hypothetical protein
VLAVLAVVALSDIKHVNISSACRQNNYMNLVLNILNVVGLMLGLMLQKKEDCFEP